MPPALAAKFTVGELAALRIISDEVRHHGFCSLHIDAIAARAGVRSRTTVKDALREAQKLGMVTVKERRRAGQRSLTNIIHIISREWRDWLAKGGGVRKSTTTDKGKKERGFRTAPGRRRSYPKAAERGLARVADGLSAAPD
jgi:hypothetical protein